MVKDFARSKIHSTKFARELILTFFLSSQLWPTEFAANFVFLRNSFWVYVLWCLRYSWISLWKFACCQFLDWVWIFYPYSHFQRSSRPTASLMDFETIRQKGSLADLARYKSFCVKLGESLFVVGDHHFGFLSIGFHFTGLCSFDELKIKSWNVTMLKFYGG